MNDSPSKTDLSTYENYTIKDSNDSRSFKVDLMDSDLRVRIEILNQMLEDYFSTNITEVSHDIFLKTFPVAKEILLEILDEISKHLDNSSNINLERIKEDLQFIESLENICENTYNNLKKVSNVSIEQIESIAKISPEMFKIILEHCKNSKQIYNGVFEAIGTNLTQIFRKTMRNLHEFVALLETVVKYDTHNGFHMNLLVDAFILVGEIANILNGLDLKSLIDTWKAFAKFFVTYKQFIILHTTNNFKLHFELLAKNVVNLLETILDRSLSNQSTTKAEGKTMQTSRLLLKILQPILTKFIEDFGKTEMDSFLYLLVNLQKCSPSYLKKIGVPDSTIRFMEVHIFDCLNPFLNILFENAHFQQTFFDYEKSENSDKIAHYLLGLTIIKKLVLSSPDVQLKWHENGNSIFDFMFHKIDALNQEILIGEVRFQLEQPPREGTRSVSIYEATLVLINGLINFLPATKFSMVEKLLLKYLLSGKFWAGLLSTDVWCFIGSSGSAELCYHHCRHLLSVHELVSDRKNCLEVILLSRLISRLYEFLPEVRKNELSNQFENCEPNFWLPLRGQLNLPKFKTEFQMLQSDIPQKFSNLMERPSINNWEELNTILKKISLYNLPVDSRTMEILTMLWMFAFKTLNTYSEGIEADLVCELIESLLNIKPKNISDENFLSVISSMTKLIPMVPPYLRIKFSYFLNRRFEEFNETNLVAKTALSSSIGELYCTLMKDKNSFAREEAFMCFYFLVYNCKNENFILSLANITRNDKEISDSLLAYLSNSVFHKLKSFPTLKEYLIEVGSLELKHVCYQKLERCRNEKLPKLEEKEEIDIRGKFSRFQFAGRIEGKAKGIIARESGQICDESNDDISSLVQEICDNLDELYKRKKELNEKTVDILRKKIGRIFN